MAFAMQPARSPVGRWPEATDRPAADDETWPRGTPVTYTVAAEELAEVTGLSTGEDIVGVTLEGVTAPEVYDNPAGSVNFAKSTRVNTFVANAVNGSGVVQTVTEALIGTLRPLRKQGTGRDAWWGVNVATVDNPVAQIIGVDTDRNIVYFKFLEGVIQEI